MKIPSLRQAKEFIAEAEQLNPGAWVPHCENVGLAAQLIARAHPKLEEEPAFILGLLHDIGRREGRQGIRHIIAGYNYLTNLGHHDAARVCLTHSFPVKEMDSILGKKDMSVEEFAFTAKYISETEYTNYDRLIQLCDALALPSGYCLLEKRLIDVTLRLGTNKYTVAKWKVYFKIKADFEREIGSSIYSLLPGVVENTFGFLPKS